MSAIPNKKILFVACVPLVKRASLPMKLSSPRLSIPLPPLRARPQSNTRRWSFRFTMTCCLRSSKLNNRGRSSPKTMPWDQQACPYLLSVPLNKQLAPLYSPRQTSHIQSTRPIDLIKTASVGLMIKAVEEAEINIEVEADVAKAKAVLGTAFAMLTLIDQRNNRIRETQWIKEATSVPLVKNSRRTSFWNEMGFRKIVLSG